MNLKRASPIHEITVRYIPNQGFDLVSCEHQRSSSGCSVCKTTLSPGPHHWEQSRGQGKDYKVGCYDNPGFWRNSENIEGRISSHYSSSSCRRISVPSLRCPIGLLKSSCKILSEILCRETITARPNHTRWGNKNTFGSIYDIYPHLRTKIREE